MIAKTPWTSRKFNFDFPVTHFPVFFIRLAGTSARIEALVKDFPEKVLEQKEEGKWSVKEHIGHLTDLDELHEGRLADYRNGEQVLRPADMKNLKTNEAKHNLVPLGKLLNDFRKSRDKFLEHLEAMDEQELNRVAMHPRLNQPMRVVDMAFFVAEHDDQHLAIIRELLSKEWD